MQLERKVEQSNSDMIKVSHFCVSWMIRLRNEVAERLSTRHSEFKSCFPELHRNDLSSVRKPFPVSIEQVDDELQLAR